MIKAINIEAEEKAIDAVHTVSEYCKAHPDCKQCFFSFSHVCMLKWVEPKGWESSTEHLISRRIKKNGSK